MDSRFEDWRIKLADTVADLASTGAFAVSSRVVPLSEVDTRLVGMTLTRNGELVDTGAGAAALGDPLAVVAWLANVLGENGIALEPGHLVMTGALHAAVPWPRVTSSVPTSTGSARSRSGWWSEWLTRPGWRSDSTRPARRSRRSPAERRRS